jgi:hypothetical protein
VLTCPNCGEENPDRARFCLGCATPLVPAAPEGGRKVVTIVFTDLTGSTALGERSAHEDDVLRSRPPPHVPFRRLRSSSRQLGEQRYFPDDDEG